MINSNTTSRMMLNPVFRLSIKVLLLTIALHATIRADTMADKFTPPGIAPGSPAGTYALNDIENINYFSGKLNFNLPLGNVSGRGRVKHTIQLPIQQQWMIDTRQNGEVVTSYPIANVWDITPYSYSPGVLEQRIPYPMPIECGSSISTVWTLKTFVFHTPDGTQYELRDQFSNGSPLNSRCGSIGPTRGRIFVTKDGTAATFISDTVVHDNDSNGLYYEVYYSGYLMLRDGTRYRIDEDLITSISDSNGNRINFVYENRLLKTITDSLNRQVTINYNVQDAAPYGLCDQITFSGFGGAARTVRVSKTYLHSALRTTQPNDLGQQQTYTQLFPELDLVTGTNGYGNSEYDPLVVSAVWLPNDQRYQLYYNVYGELARVVLPTGGATEYDWGSAGAESGSGAGPGGVFRRVVRRRTYTNGNTLTGLIDIGRPTDTGTYNGANIGPVEVKHSDPNGTLIAYEKHYFYGSPTYQPDQTHYYPRWKDGHEYRTEWLTVDGSESVLRRVEHTWQQAHANLSNDGAAPDDPRIVETVTTLVDANLVTKQSAISPYDGSVGFDQYNNQTDVYEYAFGTGAPGALLRHSHTDYLTSGYDTNTNIHLRNLPTQQQVFDADGNEKARTTYAYDEAAYPLIALGSITGWSDPATTARGNVTTISRWLNTTNTYLQTHAQYDSAGNARNGWDANGNVSTVDYSATYQYAYPTSTTSAVPDPDNNHSSNQPLTSSTAYDYNTGLVTSTTDANGQVTSFQYNDPLNRVTRVDRPSGGGWTTYEYGRAAAGDYVHIQTAQDAATTLQSYQFFDGLGRAYRSFQYDLSGGATQWLTSDTQYDALGRVWRVSANPYRSTGSDSAINPSGQWTANDYDALGRVKNITTADGAIVATQYSGNTVTVTDQAGKARKSVTDALGRLTQVIEDPSGFNYQTNYSYDVLGNLRTVAQGQQTRTFVYDSLSRLTSATNPESGTLSYQYDANGNLRFRTDARGTSTEYRYDNLNRNIITLYRVGGAPDPQTPDIERLYDRAGNGRGRAWLEWTWGTARSQTYIGAYDGMGRVTVRSESLADSLGWHSYDMNYAYDLAGNVTGITYPSGHTVSYTYDGVGRAQQFSGSLGDGAGRTYSSNTQYDAASRMTLEQYGTGTPLYHKLHYNVRGQLYDVRLSSVNDEWNWNRGAIVNYYGGAAWQQSSASNNGNVTMSQSWVPTDDGISNYNFTEDRYAYDGLNRLQSVGEFQQGATQTSAQSYAYDQYGNRTINQSQTWGAGINNRQFSVDQATNRLGVPAGQQGALGYDAAGNLTTDTYTGAGGRTYDAENRMTTTTANGTPASWYVYDSEGKRVRRHDGTAEVWHVYGLSGELLAEYAAGTLSPQKEYGYRSGELLVIAGASTGGGTAASPAGLAASPAPSGANVTLSWGAATGAANYRVERKVAGGSFGLLATTASTTYGDTGVSVGSAYLYRLCAANASGICTSDYSNVALATLVGFTGSGFTDATIISFADDPTGATVTPVRAAHITELRQTVNAVRALASLPAAAWTNATVAPGATINADDVRDLRTKLDEALMALGIQTSAYADASLAGAPNGTQIKKIHITQLRERATRGSGAASSGGGGGTGQSTLQWLVNDQLGTPRMVVDQSGSLASVKRHDYLPFGEELFAGTGGRTSQQGYVADNVRQKFTSKERDDETGLDYFGARYYSSAMGRWTSPDWSENPEPIPHADLTNPQSLNLYAYVNNNPLFTADSDGHSPDVPEWLQRIINAATGNGYKSDAEIEAEKRAAETKQNQLALKDAEELQKGGYDPNQISQLSNQQVIDFYNAVQRGETSVTSDGDTITTVEIIPSGGTTKPNSNPRTVGQDLKNVRDISSGRLKGYSRGNTNLPGGAQAAKDTFRQLTGRDPAGTFDRVVQGGKEVVYRALSKSGPSKVEVVDHAQKFVEKISFK